MSQELSKHRHGRPADGYEESVSSAVRTGDIVTITDQSGTFTERIKPGTGAVDDAIKRGDFASIPRTLTVEDATHWWTLQMGRAMLKFVRGGLTPDEISHVFATGRRDGSGSE